MVQWQNKFIIGISIGVVALIGLLLYAQPPVRQPNGGSVANQPNGLVADEMLYDFGAISMRDGKVATTFTFENTQGEAVKLTRLYTSCLCTEATLEVSGRSRGPFSMPGHGPLPVFSETLLPDASAKVKVVFDPTTHGPLGVGLIERMVILAGDRGILATMRVKANVKP